MYVHLRAGFFVLITLVVPYEDLHSRIGGGLHVCSVLVQLVCIYSTKTLDSTDCKFSHNFCYQVQYLI